MSSPAAHNVRLDCLAARGSLDMYSSDSIASIIESMDLQHSQNTGSFQFVLPLGAPPEPASIMAEDVAATEASIRQPLLSAQDHQVDISSLQLLEKDEPCAMEEAARLAKLAVPLAMQSLAAMLVSIISTTFVGHLNDPLALSAVVLSASLYNVSGMSINIGLASAMDTLCGQAFGAARYGMLGEVQQRARYICWTASLPIAASWFFIEPVLVALGQDADLSALAAANMRLLIPALFLGVINDTTRRYLVAQRCVFPTSCCYIITLCLSPLYNYLFIFCLGWRVPGAAVATVCCTATNSLLLSLYQVYRDRVTLRGSPAATWQGYTWRAFRGWRQYLSLGLPAAAMICLEWWVWELLVIMAGLLPNAGTIAVGVMGLAIQISSPSYMVPSSFGSATAVRVANLLGAGLPGKARLASRVAFCVILSCMLVLGSGTYLARHWIVLVFTSDLSIRDATAVVVPAVATALVGDGMVAVLSSVLRACGRQALGALMNVIGYWVICLPLAYLFGFVLGYGVLGFWIALTLSTAFQSVVFGVLIWRLNWDQEVVRARALTAAHHGDHHG